MVYILVTIHNLSRQGKMLSISRIVAIVLHVSAPSACPSPASDSVSHERSLIQQQIYTADYHKNYKPVLNVRNDVSSFTSLLLISSCSISSVDFLSS